MKIERPVLEWNGVDHSQLFIWVLLVWAAILILNPRIAWAWEWWAFRDKPEPSDLWIWVTRLGALLGVGILIWMLQNPGPLEFSVNAQIP